MAKGFKKSLGPWKTALSKELNLARKTVATLMNFVSGKEQLYRNCHVTYQAVLADTSNWLADGNVHALRNALIHKAMARQPEPPPSWHARRN